jgi:hypothetical protein
LDCLRRNVINYATATYYLLSREDEFNNKWLFINVLLIYYINTDKRKIF